MANVFANSKQFKDAFQTRVEQMYGVKFEDSTPHQRYFTLGTLVREHIASNWIETNEAIVNGKHKQVFYFSMEFLMGRLLTNNMMNLGIRSVVDAGLSDLGIDVNELELVEADAGLGNGGLGRLAACFMDSIASLAIPGHGNGLRYRYGFFEQKVIDGYQVEIPDKWLQRGFVWEVRKSNESVEVPFYGHVELVKVDGREVYKHVPGEYVRAVPYDVPVVGDISNGNKTVNTLRLWSSEPTENEYPSKISAVEYEKGVRNISEFLYPDDSTEEGKILRLKQQYFFVAAGVRWSIRQHKETYGTLDNYHEKNVLHINDTHPALIVPELMRILIDEEGYDWEQAWSITTQATAYTNHTILAEALEKWPVRLFQPLLPRIYMITEEINRRYCLELLEKYTDQPQKVAELAIIGHNQVRMAHLAIVGSFSVNGVAQLHTDILTQIEMKDFNELYPTKFNNKTNGITHRRWLLHCNPELVKLLDKEIGTGYHTNTFELAKLEEKVNDKQVKAEIAAMKLARKQALIDRIKREQGIELDPNSIFDIQVKRLHAYKRQLLNAMHIMYVYNRLKEDAAFKANFHPQSFIFGAKAASGYKFAKKVIKLINSIANKVNNDPDTKDLLKVVFVENYNVTYAEVIFPAADLSEQISTASKEASGTGNMKFMMNGGMTIGTMDGANVEIHELVGDDNSFIFGLTADEVNNYYQNGGYNPWDIYNTDARIKRVLDQLVNGFLTPDTEEFRDIFNAVTHHGDEYFVLKDFDAYVRAQELANETYKNQDKWLAMSIINIARSGKFSSDRTIEEYRNDIWHTDKLTF
ncbi:MAG TPA: glycogen phosphorylase, partial [Firmicutes bacterium]|nr:glycogen phosphorylase [Bacillota bacterium]